ncbi:MAG: DUF58 domain-containing protein [Luteitalea sp.]|nr:DUF58 domain-containing protein [Luteitalea sp.]
MTDSPKSSGGGPPSSRFLLPAVVAGLGTLDLKARTIVEGLMQGLHRSPFRGYSVEFAEYRQYLPGDDLATVDWKVYARTDRHVVRKYEEERNLDCHLLVDVSASMGYGGRAGMTKLDYASCLAASIAYLLQRQHDAVGLVTFDHRIVTRIAPSSRRGQVHALLVALERVQVGTRSNLAAPLEALADSITRRGLIMVFSDLLHAPDRVVRSLRYVRSRGMEVVVFQVLDPDELTFPFEGAARFQDVESADEVLADPARARDGYLRRMDELTRSYERELRGADIDYQLVDTSRPLDLTLLTYLAGRGRGVTR